MWFFSKRKQKKDAEILRNASVNANSDTKKYTDEDIKTTGFFGDVPLPTNPKEQIDGKGSYPPFTVEDDQKTVFVSGFEESFPERRITLINRFNPNLRYSTSFQNKVTIGRKSEISTLVISDDKSISKAHCCIEDINGFFFITNKSETNGTILNGRKITSTVSVKDGDVIKLGRSEFVISFS